MNEDNAVSDMYDAPVDVKQAQDVLKRNQPPQGTYTSMVEEFEPTVEPFRFEGDERLYYTVVLRGAITVKGQDAPVEQSLRFRFSQEIRPATKFGTNEVIEGKDDSASKRYAELVQAYLLWAGDEGEALKNVGQLADFIKTVPLQIRTMNGDNGINVTGVSYKKSR